MNFERLYNYRFQDIDQDGRVAVWREISRHVHGIMGQPQKILDLAAGRGEFIGSVPALRDLGGRRGLLSAGALQARHQSDHRR